MKIRWSDHSESIGLRGTTRRLTLILGACAALGVATAARATDGVWITNANGSWSNGVNWADGAIADGAGSTVWFTNNITGNRTVTLDDTPRTVGAMTLGDSTHSFTLGSAAGPKLTLDNSGADAQINQNSTSKANTIAAPVALGEDLLVANASANLMTFSGGLTGDGDLTLKANGAGGFTFSAGTFNPAGALANAGTGAGVVTFTAGVVIGGNVGAIRQESATSMLVLGGANAFAGSVTVTGGTLRVDNVAGIGNCTGPVSLGTNTFLRGTGACLSVVTNGAGATLSPGTAVNNRGILTVGDLVWQEAGIFQCDVGSLADGAEIAGIHYDQVKVNGALTAQPGGGKLVLKLSSLGQTLSVVAGQNYTLWLMPYGSASGLDVDDIQLDASAFLVSGGTWFLTNMYNSICYVNRGGGAITPDPTKNCWMGSGYWSNGGNWSWGHAPLAGEDVAFDTWSTAPCTADAVNDNLGSLTLNHGLNKVTFAPSAVSGGMSLTVTNIAVNAGQLIFGGDTGTALGSGYSIQAANIAVAAGATLSADEQGFLPGAGPSPAGSSVIGQWGASHGGYGGVYYSSSTEILAPAPRYGTASHPASLGSGGTAFAGGGALKLTATGAITIQGTLSASSTNRDTRCASGGSIWISGGNLEGNGRIIANGGLGSAAATVGGGGGRIDISGAVNNFTGEIAANFGGFSYNTDPTVYATRRGMVGSIVLPQAAGTGLTLDNFAPTRNIAFGNSLAFGTMTITNVTVGVQAYDNTTVVACDTLAIRDKGTLKCWGDFFAVNAAAGGTANRPHGHGPIIEADTITVEAGGAIDADNTGFTTTKFSTYLGPGGFGYYTRDALGAIDYYTSSAHGGQAGGRRGRSASFPSVTSRTPMYGIATGPTTLGSAGSSYPVMTSTEWSSGGGAVKLDVSGTLAVHGRISADATTASTGGYNQPSGGSVWITGGGTLQGSGRISANGAIATAACGGGGGGRVDISGIVNNFAGVLQAKGGTKFDAASQQTRGLTGSLVLPTIAGASGAVLENFTPYGTDFAFGNSTVFGDCVITNGVVLSLDANDGQNVFTFRSLTIKAGGEVRCLGNLPAINEASGGTATSLRGTGPIIVATNLTIEAGGSLNANGQGYTYCWRADKAAAPYPNPTIYPGGVGYGPYQVLTASPWVVDTSAGAGFGGLAGKGAGFTYGSITNFGSGALGSGTKEYAGGGAIRLDVPGTLLNYGVISCDGAGAGDNGGGSGGSLLVNCGTLAGSGSITARGASPVLNASTKIGGGGGRVFLSYHSLGTLNPVVDGRITAYGGGTNAVCKGAAGTVVLVDKAAADGFALLVENDRPAENTATQLAADDFSGTPPTLLIERVLIGTDGVLKLPANDTLAVSQVFSNRGEFVSGPCGTLALVGAGEARVYGDIVTTNFLVSGAATPKTVKFEPGKTITVGGALTMSNATVRSQADRQAWRLVHKKGGSQSVVYVRAKDSDASGGQKIYATKPSGELVGLSYDLGGNQHWIFSRSSLVIVR